MGKYFFVLGPAGTHSHLAAVKFLGGCFDFCFSEKDLVFCSSNAEVLSRAKEEESFCIVAIENAFGGLVDESVRFWLEQLTSCSVRVVAERFLRVRHNLMMRRGGCVKCITKVVSHPQAISQCSENIKRICPEAVVSEVKSTAAAARSVSEDTSGTIAAIAPGFAAVIYGLETVQRHVHDDHLRNVTRFHVVGPNRYIEENAVDFVQPAKTAVIFRAPDIHGSLSEIFSFISDREVNISSMHSIPLGVMGEYAFYCELDCHQLTPEGIAILDGMRRVDENLLVLGSFPSSSHPFL